MGERKQSDSGKPATRAVFLMLLLVLAATAAGTRANFWKADLHVATVQVRGNRIVPGEDLISLAHINTGERLFDVDLYAASKRLLENRFVQSASVNRDVPDRITISVTERAPVAAIVAQKKFYIDAEGYVLPPTLSDEVFDIPVITGSVPPGELVPGKQVSSPLVKEALGFFTTSQALGDEIYRQFSELHIAEGKDIIAYTADGGVPVIVGHGDVATKLVRFDGFWKDVVLHAGVQELQYIDLRFEDRVVVRWNHRPEAPQAAEM